MAGRRYKKALTPAPKTGRGAREQMHVTETADELDDLGEQAHGDINRFKELVAQHRGSLRVQHSVETGHNDSGASVPVAGRVTYNFRVGDKPALPIFADTRQHYKYAATMDKDGGYRARVSRYENGAWVNASLTPVQEREFQTFARQDLAAAPLQSDGTRTVDKDLSPARYHKVAEAEAAYWEQTISGKTDLAAARAFLSGPDAADMIRAHPRIAAERLKSNAVYRTAAQEQIAKDPQSPVSQAIQSLHVPLDGTKPSGILQKISFKP